MTSATATTAVTNGRTDVVLVGEAAFVADVAGAALEAESELPRRSSRECKTKKTLTIPTVSKNKKQFIDEEEESEEEGEIKSEEKDEEIESEEEEVEIVSEFEFSGVDGDASDEEEDYYYYYY